MSGMPRTGTDGRELRTRGERTRRRLFDAAILLLAKQGMHGTRIADIVAEAGTSHGTFYRYFESKEALLDELVSEVASDFLALVEEFPAGSDQPLGEAELGEWVARFGELYHRHRAALEVWTEAESAGVSAGKVGNQVFGSLSGAIAAAAPGLDPVVAPLALILMCDRLNYYRTTRQVRATTAEVADVLTEILASCLLTPAAPAR